MRAAEQVHVFMVPRRTIVAERILEDEEVNARFAMRIPPLLQIRKPNPWDTSNVPHDS